MFTSGRRLAAPFSGGLANSIEPATAIPATNKMLQAAGQPYQAPAVAANQSREGLSGGGKTGMVMAGVGLLALVGLGIYLSNQ